MTVIRLDNLLNFSKKILPLALFTLWVSCRKSNEIDVKKQAEIISLADSIMHSKKIDFRKVFAVVKSHSTDVYRDTGVSKFRPSPLIYSNTYAGTSFKIYEQSKGKISIIQFYKSGEEIATCEYYDNGQIKCLFDQNSENGPYECFHKNGKLRQTGWNKDGRAVKIETGYDSLGVKIYKHFYD